MVHQKIVARKDWGPCALQQKYHHHWHKCKVLCMDYKTPFIMNVHHTTLLGGASSAVRAQCNYLGVWPY